MMALWDQKSNCFTVSNERGAGVGVMVVRRELRKWLRASDEGRAVEEAVGRLLGGG